jgi:hypothetical protein
LVGGWATITLRRPALALKVYSTQQGAVIFAGPGPAAHVNTAGNCSVNDQHLRELVHQFGLHVDLNTSVTNRADFFLTGLDLVGFKFIV